MCKPIVIANKGNVSVTQCANCKMVNIWGTGVLISFSFDQFHAFINATKHLNFDDYTELHPDGTEVVILATPYSDVSLTFTRESWYEFFSSLHEAAYMLQVYQLVHT